MKRMSAEQAAEIIQHDDMVAFSGFTPAGSPKALQIGRASCRERV